MPRPSRKDDGQRVVEHPQIADHLVEGNEAAAEEHGDREEDHKELAEGQRLAGERPCGRHRKDDREDGVGKRVPDGVAVTDPDVCPLETADIAREINIDGKEIHFAREHGVRTREGGNDDEVERVDDDERKEEKHEVDDRVVDAVSAALPDAVFLRLFVLLHTAEMFSVAVFCIFPPPQKSEFSENFREQVFAMTSRTRLMTELKRPTAVA